MSVSGIEGDARSTQTNAFAAGFSQLLSRLVTCSVLPFRWTNIVSSSVPDFHRERSLRSGQTGDWDAIWRRAHVIHSGLLKEMNGCRVAAVFTADADLQILARQTAALDANRDDRAHAVDVDRRERILVENLLVLVDLQEFPDIVSRKAERQLREVVRAKGEELRLLRDLIGSQGTAGHFD